MKKVIPIVLALSLAPIAFAISAPPDMHTFQQAVTALRHDPGNDQLRIKIIKLARQMQPVPSVPSRARQEIDRGAKLREEAEGMSDYKHAVTEYRAAIADAPWWGEAYLKASDALQDAGLYDEAIKDLNFYIMTDPGKQQVEDAKQQIDSAKAAKQYEEEAAGG